MTQLIRENTSLQLTRRSTILSAFLLLSTLASLHATNNALSFNGGSYTDQRVTIPSRVAYNGNGPFTLEFWFKRNSSAAPATYENIIGKDNYSKSDGWAVVLQYNTGKLRFETYGVSGGLTSNFGVFDTNWHHFALTRSAGGFTQIYIDGVLDISANINSPTNNSLPLKIGNADSGTNGFYGKVDEVRFWNTERVGTDINCSRRVSLAGNEANLQSYFNMDAGSGQAVTDLGPLANNGNRGLTNTNENQDPAWIASNIPNFGSACDVTAPTGKITFPANGATPVISALAVISGTSGDNTDVGQIRSKLIRNSDGFFWNDNGKYWSSAFVENPLPAPFNNWTFPGNTVFWNPNTSYTFMITVLDLDGNQVVDTVNFTAMPDVDATLPTITIDAPANGSSHNDNQLTVITGNANDNVSLSQVTVSIKRNADNQYWNANSVVWMAGPIDNFVNGLYAWQLNVPIHAWAQPGAYTLTATAKDTSNNIKTTNAVNFTINSNGDTTQPTISVQYPVTATDYNAADLLTLSGIANDNVALNQVSVTIIRLSDYFYWNNNTVSWVSNPTNNYTSGLSNWQLTLPISAWSQSGNYTMNATGFDTSNNAATSNSINFSIGGGGGGDSTLPDIVIQSPADACDSAISSLATLSGTSDDNVSVQNIQLVLHGPQGYWNTQGKYWSGGYISNAVSGLAAWTFPGSEVTWNAGGSYSLTMTATDSSGNQRTVTSNFTAVADVETIVPTLTVNFPAQNGVYAADQLTLFTGIANDNVGLSNVRVRVTRISDNLDWNPNTVNWAAGPLSFNASGLTSWQYTLPVSAFSQSGNYVAAVTATDLSNNQSNQIINFSVSSGGGPDYVAPTVSINHPGNNSTQAPSALVTMSGLANDDRDYVEVSASVKDLNTNLWWNGANFNLGSESFSILPGGNPWNLSSIPSNSWTDGHQYRLRAKARDGNNNITYASSDFTVNASAGDTIAPYVTITTPVNGSVYTPTTVTMNGSAGDNVNLQIVEVSIKRLSTLLYYNGASFTSGVQTFLPAAGLASWTFSLPAAAFANDSYLLEVRAKDAANNAQTQSVTFTISGAGSVNDSVPPTGAINTPSNNGSYNGANSLATLSGVTADNTQVSEALIWMRDSSNKYFNGNSWTSDAPVTQSVGTASPWQFAIPINAWKNDSFTIFLQIRDTANNLTTVSNQFTVSGISGGGTADSVPPQIYSYNPFEAANLNPNAFTNLSGRAEDAFGIANITIALKKVTGALYYNGASFTSATRYPLYPTLTNNGSGIDFNHTVAASIYTNGSYVLEIEATDQSGNVATRNVNFTVYGAGQGAGDLTPPTVSIAAPTNNTTYTSAQLTSLAGASSDDTGIDRVDLKITRTSDGFTFDGGLWRSGEYWIRAAGTTNWSMTLAMATWSDGNYILTARTRDLAAKETFASNNFTISGTGAAGGTPPTITISALSNGQIYQPANLVNIGGNAVDDVSVSQVQLRITDLNLNMDWNPISHVWIAGTNFFNASLAATVWSAANMPYWNNGHYQVTAQAVDNSNLLSVPAVVDFFVSGTNGGGADYTPPASIQNLAAVSGQNPGSVQLSWTATGDDGNTGTATAVIVKYGPNPINETNWASAIDITAPPVNAASVAPQVAGTPRTLTLNGLTPGINYFFGIRARDEAFNMSPFSNSASAVASAGCQTADGDGEGLAVIAPLTFPTSTNTNITVTLTVGSHGILPGGKVKLKIPDGWMYPQTYSPTMAGYVSAATSNGSVSLALMTVGQMVEVTTSNGSLNQHDTITFSIKARNNGCELQNNVSVDVLTQATACGIPTKIASVPTVSYTAGNATWIGFEYPEKFAQVGQVTAIKLLGKNSCGQVANVGNNTNITVSALKQNNNYAFVADAGTLVSNNVNMTGGANPANVTFNGAQNNMTIYYKLPQNSTTDNPSVKIQYQDFTGNYTAENTMRIFPLAGESVLSNVSIDTGMLGNQTDATMTPNGDGVNDQVNINAQVASDISSTIEILKNNVVVTTLYGWGRNVRIAWNGYLNYPVNGYATSGNYTVQIKAGGVTDNSLTFSIQSTGIQGTIKNQSNNTALEAVRVDLFGANFRNTQTLSDGTFEFGSLTPGQYTLHIEKQGFEPQDLNVNFTGTNQNLGNILLAPIARIVVNATRSNTLTSFDLWGAIRTKETSANSAGVAYANELWNTLHFAYGRADGDAGATTDKPSIPLKAGVNYTLHIDLPGFTTPDLTKTLAAGQTFTWNVNLTAKKGVSGFISLGNGIANTSGYWINIAAGIKDPNNNAFLKGYAEKFSSAFLPAGEVRVPYTLADMNAGTYLLTFDTPGLSQQTAVVTMAGSDMTQDITLTKGGAGTVNVTLTGNTSLLDSNDGNPADNKFQVSIRYSDGGSYGFQTAKIDTNANTTSAAISLTGLANKTYDLFFDPIDGFSPVVPGPYRLTMSGGTGTLNVNFAQDSGILRATVALPNGSVLANTHISLYKEGNTRSNPTISGNQFTFNRLGSGRYNVSIYDPASGASRYKEGVFVANGQTTQISLDLNAVSYYSISGTVRTVAAPPYDSLATIAANSINNTFHTTTGDQSISSVRVQAELLNDDGTVDGPPILPGQILNSTKFKWGLINTANGTYSIDGLEKGRAYLVSVFNDFTNDGKPDIPRTTVVVSPVSDMTQDFLIQRGADITVALTLSDSEDDYQVNVQLVDAALKQVIQEKTISLSGTSASTTFSNLQIGNYLVQIKDENTPVKYTAKPAVASILTLVGNQTVSVSLQNSGFVQFALANKYGTVVTANNKDQVLPKNTVLRLSTRGQIINMEFDNTLGKFRAPILPNIDYDLAILPPPSLGEEDAGKSFLPILLHARISQAGDTVDLNTITLKQGKTVEGEVVDESGNGIPRSPVLAYQSLSKSLAPVKTYTNEAGKFRFENLSETVRYYDFVANPLGNNESLPTFTEGQKLSIDIQSDNQISNLLIALKSIQGSIKGHVESSSEEADLYAGYGTNSGRPGVSVLLTLRDQNKTLEYVTDADGNFLINVPSGLYDVELIAKDHMPKRLTNILITNTEYNAGTITLAKGGSSLSGKIRTSDGSLPTTADITELRASDDQKNTFRADLNEVAYDSVSNVDGFVFYGLQANTIYKIFSVDELGRAKVLEESFEMPATDVSHNLTFNITQPILKATFIYKLPEHNEMNARFSCNQKLRYRIESDNDLSKFVEVTKGNGVLVGNAISDDRYNADYTYTLGSGDESSDYTEFTAKFNTEGIDPTTGNNFSAEGVFRQPTGIISSQADEIDCSMGGQFVMVSGARYNIPPNSCVGAGHLMMVQESGDLGGLNSEIGLSSLGSDKRGSGVGTMATAKRLGAKAYPSAMYKAIQALEEIDVNPFSAFTDIFIPAGMSHVFDLNNKPTLCLKYDDSADPEKINVYYFNEAQGIYTIEKTNRRTDLANHTITVDVGHASVFTVLASNEPIIRGGTYTGDLDVFNFPNPFDLNTKTVTLKNPGSNNASQNIQGTMMRISVPAAMAGLAKIEIYNMAGELVRTLEPDLTGGSANYVEWDGTNDHGAKVASGVYIGHIKIGSEKKFFKMAVVK